MFLLRIYTGGLMDHLYEPYEPTWWDWNSWWVIPLIVLFSLILLCAIFLIVRRILRRNATPLKVTFYGYKEREYKYGSYLQPDIPVKEGYTFCGWYKDTSFLEPCKSTYKVKRDIILYPKWEKER